MGFWKRLVDLAKELSCECLDPFAKNSEWPKSKTAGTQFEYKYTSPVRKIEVKTENGITEIKVNGRSVDPTSEEGKRVQAKMGRTQDALDNALEEACKDL